MKNPDHPEARNTVIATLGLWAAAVALGARADVFARLPGEVVAALCVAAGIFAVATVTLDAGVRDWLAGLEARSAWLVVLGLDAVAVAFGALPPGGGVAAWAPFLVFALPVTLALGASTAKAPWNAAGAALRKPAAAAPPRRPGASAAPRTSAPAPGGVRARAAG